MNTEPLEEILDTCLQRLARGESTAQVLADYPQQAAELGSLLEAARLAGELRAEIRVPPAAMARSRAGFLQAAARPRRLSLWGELRRGWAIASLTAALFVAAAGTGLVSAQSLPGDQLYPVKIAAEQARLNLVKDPVQRLQITAGYDRERVDEVEALFARDQVAPVAVSFAGFLSRPDPIGDWRVGAITLILPPGLPGMAQLRPGMYVQVNGTVEASGKVAARNIYPQYEHLSGPVEEIGTGSLTVDRITLDLSATTQISGQPRVGDMVNAEVMRQEDGGLEAYSLDVSQLPAQETAAPTGTLEPTETPEITPQPTTQTSRPDGETSGGEHEATPQPSGSGETSGTRTPSPETDH